MRPVPAPSSDTAPRVGALLVRAFWPLAAATLLVAGVAAAGSDKSKPSAKQAAEPEAAAAEKSHALDPPDAKIDGFPVWFAKESNHHRIAVVLEPLDVENKISAREAMRAAADVADRIFSRGVDILMVDFPDGRKAPDTLAPTATRAIQAAAQSSHSRVGVIGLGAGAVTARWALSAAEARGEKLPVHTLVSIDAPNRGYWFSPGLQAFVLRYGKGPQKEALKCAAARALFACYPEDVRWKKVGIGPLGRKVPREWNEEKGDHRKFFDRLRGMNAYHGYPDPSYCQTVLTSNGSVNGKGGWGDLLHLWLPFHKRWNLDAQKEDHVPGALLPTSLRNSFSVRPHSKTAGAYMPGWPTFLATSSALDAEPDGAPADSPRIARPDRGEPIPDDQVDHYSLFKALGSLFRRFDAEEAPAGGGAQSLEPGPALLQAPIPIAFVQDAPADAKIKAEHDRLRTAVEKGDFPTLERLADPKITGKIDGKEAPDFATIKKRLEDVLAKMKGLSIKETKVRFPASADASIQEVDSTGDLEYKDNQGQQQFGSFEVHERWQKVDDRWLLIRLVSRLSD